MTKGLRHEAVPPGDFSGGGMTGGTAGVSGGAGEVEFSGMFAINQ